MSVSSELTAVPGAAIQKSCSHQALLHLARVTNHSANSRVLELRLLGKLHLGRSESVCLKFSKFHCDTANRPGAKILTSSVPVCSHPFITKMFLLLF
jgi:hypothetical protein